MPDISNYDDKQEWMKDCIPAMIDEGSSEDQAVAACINIWAGREIPDKQPDEKIIDFKIGTFRVIEKEDKKLYIRGYASPEFDDNGKKVIDEHGTSIKSASARKAITEAMTKYMKRGGPILHNHDDDRVLGKTLEWGVDNIGLWIEAAMDDPITDQEKSTWNKVRSGSLKGLSIHFGNDYEVTAEKIDGEKIPIILVRTILEISITPVPSNGGAVFDSFMRSITNKQKENSIMPGTTEKIWEMPMSEYRELLKVEASYQLDQVRLANLTEDLKRKEKECELAGLTMEAMIKKEDFEIVNKRNLELIKATEDMQKEKDDLTKRLKEMEDNKSITLDISERLGKVMKETRDIAGSGSPVDLILTEFERRCIDENAYNEDGTFNQHIGVGYGLNRQIAEYIYEETRENRKDIVNYSPLILAERFATKNKIEYDVKEFHKRALQSCRVISTTTGIMKQSDIEYQPISMDSMPIPLYKVVPQEPLKATTFTWYQRTAYNGADFDAEGATPTSGDSTFGAKTSTCKYLYVCGKVNDPAEKFSAISMIALELQSNRYAMKKMTDWALLHGNSSADAYAFDGLAKQTEANTLQVYDLTSAVMTIPTFNDIDERYMTLAEFEDETGILPKFHFCDTRTYKKVKNVILDLYKAYNQIRVVVAGIQYLALEHNGVLFIRDPSYIDYVTTPCTIAAAALAGGSLADDTYYLSAEAVTKSGRTLGSAEVNATTETTNNSVRVTITMVATYRYVRLFWSESTGLANHKLIQTVENTTGAGAQVVDIIAEPTSKFSQPVAADGKEGRIMSFKVGGLDGLRLKVAALEEYVEKGRVGNFKEFYLRSYLTTVFGDEKIVLETEVAHTA